ncbi:hypothetical protein X797_012316 [Metarhizium robertsii]|uniref:Gag protein n=2 Tax=Metarhizium robertsii TaxID=568076 RepID=E9EKC2_METRA|nr:gag protein [Metarhizium robertsii ARSEF 23]EFZ03863.1 gag protein [Metarhizium robertsii ARSEF 23]EXU94610.1 hypothetical protein X797_012316 [Metarhizium robertsii]
MAPTEKSSRMILQGPDEWESWSEKFKARAISDNIWKYANPETDDELEEEPPMPDIGKYPRRQIIGQDGQSPSTGRSRRTAEGDQSQTLESSSQHQYFSQSFERPHPTLMARGVHDLLPADRSTYDLEVRIRTQEVRDIKEKQASISKLRTWVEESISDHLWTTCCNAEDTIRVWYTGIRTSVCADDVQLRSKARDRYQRAIQPLKKTPQDFEAWIIQWREAFAYAKIRDVADVAHSADWLKDVSKAVKDVLPAWGSSFRNGHLAAIRSDTLDYKEVAASLYDEADVQNILKKQPQRVHKGAFGPAFGPESDQGPEESQDQSTGQRKGRKRNAKNEKEKETASRKRKREDSDNQGHHDNLDIGRCSVCGLRGHGIKKCFYVNKSIAPDHFRGNRTIKAGIEYRLANDKAFAKEVKRQLKAKNDGHAQQE